LAMARGRPVISLGGWRIVDPDGRPVEGATHVTTPEEAVDRAVDHR